jgi:membrane-bound ClpP family serine protease
MKLLRREEKLQLIWAVTFVMSGMIFALAFWFTPIIGVLAVLGYVVLYVGLAVAFLVVFRGMERLGRHAIDDLEIRRREIVEIKDALEKKFLRKKISRENYEKMVQDYEQKLTEIEIKVKHLKRAI